MSELILKELRDALPGRTVELLYVPSEHRYSLIIDGVERQARWSLEAEETILRYHNLSIKDEILKAIVKDVLDQLNTSKSPGLQSKYRVTKANGKPTDPDADYFVLRLDTKGELNHVAACHKAIRAYANAIQPFLPELTKDLYLKYKLDNFPYQRRFNSNPLT